GAGAAEVEIDHGGELDAFCRPPGGEVVPGDGAGADDGDAEPAVGAGGGQAHVGFLRRDRPPGRGRRGGQVGVARSPWAERSSPSSMSRSEARSPTRLRVTPRMARVATADQRIVAPTPIAWTPSCAAMPPVTG